MHNYLISTSMCSSCTHVQLLVLIVIGNRLVMDLASDKIGCKVLFRTLKMRNLFYSIQNVFLIPSTVPLSPHNKILRCANAPLELV